MSNVIIEGEGGPILDAEGLALHDATSNIIGDDFSDFTLNSGTQEYNEADIFFVEDAACTVTDASATVQDDITLDIPAASLPDGAYTWSFFVKKPPDVTLSHFPHFSIRSTTMTDEVFTRFDALTGNTVRYAASGVNTTRVEDAGEWWRVLLDFDTTGMTTDLTLRVAPAAANNMTPESGGFGNTVGSIIISKTFLSLRQYSSHFHPQTIEETNCSVSFTDIEELPDAGVTNNFCGQLIFTIPDDIEAQAAITRWFSLQGVNIQNRLDIRTNPSGNGIQLSTFVGNTAGPAINIPDAGPQYDVRYRTSTAGLYLSVNGTVITDDDTFDGWTVPLDTVTLAAVGNGSNRGNCVYKWHRLEPTLLTDAEIEAWPTIELPPPLPDLPDIELPSDWNLVEGDSGSYDLDDFNLGGDADTWELPQNFTWLSVAGSTLTWTNAVISTGTFTLVARNEAGYDFGEVAYTVAADLLAPDLDIPATPFVIDEGDSDAFNASAWNEGGEPDTWELSNNPAWLTIDNDGLMTWTDAQAGDDGTYTITATNTAGTDDGLILVEITPEPVPDFPYYDNFDYPDGDLNDQEDWVAGGSLPSVTVEDGAVTTDINDADGTMSLYDIDVPADHSVTVTVREPSEAALNLQGVVLNATGDGADGSFNAILWTSTQILPFIRTDGEDDDGPQPVDVAITAGDVVKVSIQAGELTVEVNEGLVMTISSGLLTGGKSGVYIVVNTGINPVGLIEDVLIEEL